MLVMRSLLEDRVMSVSASLCPLADRLASYSGDDSKGYFIQPTVILTKDAKSITLVDEIFGPVVTVR